MRAWICLLLLTGATPVLAEERSRYDPFSNFYAPTDMLLGGQRSVAAQASLARGDERTVDAFSHDDGDTDDYYTDFHLILTNAEQRMQVGAFFSSGEKVYTGTTMDLMSRRTARVQNKTAFSIIGIDLASSFNEHWTWALRMQTVRYTLGFRFDDFSGSFGEAGYSAYSPSIAWHDGDWTVRLGYQPTINFVSAYPVRLPGHTKLTLINGTAESSWSLQLTHYRERAVEKDNVDSYELMVGADQRLGDWGWDGFVSHQTKAWKKAQLIKATSIAHSQGGVGAKWFKSEGLVLGARLAVDQGPRVLGDSQGSRFEADLLQGTLSLYVDYVIDAPKNAATHTPATP